MPKLTIDIEARLATFQDSLDQVKRSTDGLVGNIERRFQGLTTVFGALGAAISAVGLTQFVRNAIDAADELDDVAQKSGIAVESLSALGYAAKIEGISVEAFGGSITKLNVNLQAAAQGSKETQQAFAAVGIAAGELNSIRPDEAFRRIAEAFAGIRDGSEKSALAVRLFGKSGADLIPLLNQGAAGLARSADEARRFGLIVSAETAAAAATFNDNLTKLRASAEGLGTTIGNIVLPTLTRFTEELLAGQRIAGSFIGALSFGFTNPFRDATKNVAALRKEYEDLQRARERYVKSNADTSAIDAALKAIDKQIQFARLQSEGFRQPDDRGAARSRSGAAGRALALRNAPAGAEVTQSVPADASDPFGAGSERMGRRWAQAQFDQFAELSRRAKDYQAELLRTFEQGNETDAKAVQDFADKVRGLLAGTKSGQTAAVTADLGVLNDALILGKINADQYEEAFKLIEDRFARINGVSSDVAKTVSEDWRSAFKDLEFAVQGWGRGFTEEILNMVKTGQLNFSKLVDSILSDLARLVIQRTITKPIFDAIGGALGQGFGSLFGGSPAASSGGGTGGNFVPYGGARAGGGPVLGGAAYLIGERGPELMVPRSAGTIIPNGAFGGRVTQVFNIAPGVDAGTIYRAAQMGASMAKSDIARGMRIGEMG